MRNIVTDLLRTAPSSASGLDLAEARTTTKIAEPKLERKSAASRAVPASSTAKKVEHVKREQVPNLLVAANPSNVAEYLDKGIGDLQMFLNPVRLADQTEIEPSLNFIASIRKLVDGLQPNVASVMLGQAVSSLVDQIKARAVAIAEMCARIPVKFLFNLEGASVVLKRLATIAS